MNYDRIMLELIDRISALEDEVSLLKSEKKLVTDEIDNSAFTIGNSTDAARRDTTKYILDGKKYGKNRLVLALIQKYMNENPNTSAEELIEVFDKSLQGSLGVVRIFDEIKSYCSDYKTRFFVLPNELVKTSTQDCAVCTQWGIANIGNIIIRARQLGMDVAVVK